MDASPEQRTRKRLILTFLIALPLAGLVAMVLLIRQIKTEEAARESALPRYNAVPDFRLIEAGGRQVSLADMKGKVWIADFIYTNCTGSCPMMTMELSHIDTQLARLPDVRLVSISVDPSRDTPERLLEYARENRLSRARWILLTGEYGAIRALARDGFHLSVADSATADGLAAHSTRFALVDRNGIVRGYYDGSDSASETRLITDVNTLIQQTPPEAR